MPYLRPHFGWKMALCQHLMYLLIDEDRGEPMLAERKPPWGAPDAATYVQRIERNLSAFEKIDGLKLNYQAAGVDIESIARDFPHITAQMKEWFEKGRLDFVDGSFSQGHLHTVGSESNWRQFEYGLAVFQKLFNKRITLYARQKTSLHQQLPQILSQFGYRMIVMPHFPHSFEVIEGSFQMMSSVVGTGYMQGDEFLDATALDGTSIPVYLTPRASSHFEKDEAHDFDIPAEHAHNPDNVKWEISRDNFGPPPVWPWFPDMMEMRPEKFEAITRFCDVQFLDEALTDRIREAPPRAKARLMSHWSYIEGVWAEELLRAQQGSRGYGLACRGCARHGQAPSRRRCRQRTRLRGRPSCRLAHDPEVSAPRCVVDRHYRSQTKSYQLPERGYEQVRGDHGRTRGHVAPARSSAPGTF